MRKYAILTTLAFAVSALAAFLPAGFWDGPL
jgi:hypothetical protein